MPRICQRLARGLSLALVALVLVSTASCTAAPQDSLRPVPPQPMREFRGAWIASVANIDWPSKPGLPAAEQKQELVGLLNMAAQLKLNAVLLQVRPACDALYVSSLEPWSEYLSGQMGRGPSPHYDPLEFAIEQAHLRGLELHAWFNPFRARHATGKSPAAPNHVSRSHPSLVKSYGKELWLDPGERAAQEHSLSVILDVVKRYDIDGVHMDDYFYPYKVKDAKGRFIDFPDDTSWRRYRAGGGKLSRGDWRRLNVDNFVEFLYRRVKSAKPWVKVGISPFGIWRPGHPKEVTGLDAYDHLYADARKWFAMGYVDYLAPQLYWAVASPGQPYPLLLRWWAEQNQRNRHLWPGSDSSKAGNQWQAQEIIQQIRLARQQRGVSGHLHWSISSLKNNRGGLADAAAKQLYAEPALIPESTWLDNQPPASPKLSAPALGAPNRLQISWQPSGTERVWLWLVQVQQNGQWRAEIVPGHQTNRVLDGAPTTRFEALAVTAVDRCGNASSPAVVDLRAGRR